MIAEIHEYNGMMQLVLKPENMKEQTQLVRFGMNTKEADIVTDVYTNLTMSTIVTAKKYHRANSGIKKNK